MGAADRNKMRDASQIEDSPVISADTVLVTYRQRDQDWAITPVPNGALHGCSDMVPDALHEGIDVRPWVIEDQRWLSAYRSEPLSPLRAN